MSNIVRPETLLCGLVFALGLMVTAGWLLHEPLLTQIKPGYVPMVFNTGLCFMLSATAIWQWHGAQRLRRGVGLLLVFLCSLTFIEHLFDVNLGVDLSGLHTWYDYGNTRPGRMAPNTALGFMLVGATLLLLDRVTSKRRALAIVMLNFALLTIGLTGLVGYLLAPDLLFGWAKSARMAVHTATGMCACALALWISWSHSSWYMSRVYFREDEKIRVIGAAILLVMTVTVGLLGFVQLQSGLEKSLESSLEVIVKNRLPWFRASVDEAARHAALAARMAGPDAGARLVGEGFRGAATLDAKGRTVSSHGRFAAAPELLVPLDAQGRSALVWDGELVLRTRVGALLVDEAAPHLRAALFNAGRLGLTGEIAACVARPEGVLCFPGNLHAAPFFAKEQHSAGELLPVQRAISGASGIAHSVDYRGKNVIAAYAPLAPGLGFVAKQDTIEVYAVIRDGFAVGAPVILIIAVFGMLALNSQLKPLATRMWASELAAREKEQEMRTIMGAAGDGIVTVDQHGVIQSVNAAACSIFGYEAHELIGRAINLLIPNAALHQASVANAEMVGHSKVSGAFPLELSINPVPLSEKRLFVGVMRDISERKLAEQRLFDMARHDSLTGLPNRYLFDDRMRTAVLRAGRTGTAIALLFIDLDGFKQVNDSLGHQAGDELLIEFGRRLAAAVRKTDTVARLAGDEFTVVLEELASPQEDAMAVALKIIDAVQTPFIVLSNAATVTASIGLVLHYPQDGEVDVATLLRRADAAMYAAKRAGKNTVKTG